jgi:hypothetical protein
MQTAPLPGAKVRESLIPLRRAVELIAAAVYPSRGGGAFDGVAAAVSALIPVFVTEDGVARRLNEQELHKAFLRNGGAEIYFSDGRAPIHNLAVTRDGVARVIRVLQGALQD